MNIVTILDQYQNLWGNIISSIFEALNFRDGRFIQGAIKDIIASNYI